MSIFKPTRRQFLTGAGKSFLMLPFMSSLLPRESWAQSVAAPRRFIVIQTANGQWRSTFFPPSNFYTLNSMTKQLTRNIPGGSIDLYSRPLSQLSGDISPILKAFNNYKDRMGILDGFHPTGKQNGHNSTVMFTSSSQTGSGCTTEIVNPPLWDTSVQEVIARSTATYPAGYSRDLRLISLQDIYVCDAIERKEISWYQGQGSPSTSTAGVLWNNFFKGAFSTTSGGTPTTLKDARVRALNAVFEDYKSTNSPRRNISSVDKLKLDDFMTKLNEVAVELDKSGNNVVIPTQSCKSPTAQELTAAQGNHRTDWDLKFKLTAAAMACGVTKVMAAKMYDGTDEGDSGFHNESHVAEPNGSRTLSYQHWVAARMKVLIDSLASFPEEGGSLLDNTFVVWGNELGFDEKPINHSVHHLPIVTFGSLGGRMRTGEMIVARSSRGGNYRPTVNVILEAAMHGMGVTNYPTRVMATYNGTQVVGFGASDSGSWDLHCMGGPLPYLLKG